MNPTFREVRRLTGPSLLLARAGAVVDVDVPHGAPTESIVSIWREQVRRILDEIGRPDETIAHRAFAGGLSLAVSAPIDALYTACDVNEWAWAAALAVLDGRPAPDAAAAAVDLRGKIAAESNPALIALRDAASARGVAFLWDTELASVGLGAGARTWPVDDLPAPADVDWSAIHDVPLALVTGTNGKSTTVRLVAAMAAAAGRVPGVATTDDVRAGDDVLDRGDYSGPGGARMALRDPRVEIAVLETARGGLLRRGLAVARAGVAAVTNIAPDHLGDFGIDDLEALADVKLVVARVADRVVLNADDPLLRARAAGLGRPVMWFSLAGVPHGVSTDSPIDSNACVLDGDLLGLVQDGHAVPIARVDEVPVTCGGAARYNIANALAAIGIATGLGLPPEAIRVGLTTFANTPDSNPGRLNVFDVDGFRVVVDYAHNPHGLRALLDVTSTMPARRRLVALGQAGDRDDAALRELAEVVWESRPDYVVVKELRSHLRGRPEGEVPRVLAAALVGFGMPADAIGFAEDDLEATRQALAWARAGDLLVLPIHAQRGAVIALITR